MMTEEEIAALLEYINEKKKEAAKVEFDLKQLNQEIDESELILKRHLEEKKADVLENGIYSYGWKVTVSNRFNQKLFGEAHPDLLEKFKMPTESRKFQILINGR